MSPSQAELRNLALQSAISESTKRLGVQVNQFIPAPHSQLTDFRVCEKPDQMRVESIKIHPPFEQQGQFLVEAYAQLTCFCGQTGTLSDSGKVTL